MMISVSKIDDKHSYKELLTLKPNVKDGDIVFPPSNFSIGNCEYEISGNFSTSNENGCLILKKDGITFVRTLITVAPTFLFTMSVSEDEWLEINVSRSQS